MSSGFSGKIKRSEVFAFLLVVGACFRKWTLHFHLSFYDNLSSKRTTRFYCQRYYS